MAARTTWATGSARIAYDQQIAGHRFVLRVTCALAETGTTHPAFLDTGSQWSIIGGELAEVVGGAEHGEPVVISSRLGTHRGQRVRRSVTLCAEPAHGVDLELDAAVVLLPDWPGPSLVLGTRGLLERVRVELDPDQSGEDSWWSFAPSLR